jgi:hypothetical protein
MSEIPGGNRALFAADPSTAIGGISNVSVGPGGSMTSNTANTTLGTAAANGMNGADGVNGANGQDGTVGPIFSISNMTTGQYSTSSGMPMLVDGILSNGVDLSREVDSYVVAPMGTNTYVLTGAGNDTIGAQWTSSFCFIDAGSGNNTINASKFTSNFFQADASTAATLDTINGFNMSDLFTLNGFFNLSWSSSGGNTTLTAVSTNGFAPITVVFNGIADSSMFATSINPGGASINIALAH